MKYLLGDSITLSSTHPSDKGTSITIMVSHTLILQDGRNTATLTFEGEYNKNILLDYLQSHPPKHSTDIKLEMRLGNDNWLVVEYDNRSEPYTRGILISVGAHPLQGGVTVSVFVEDRDIPLLVSALRGQPCGT